MSIPAHYIKLPDGSYTHPANVKTNRALPSAKPQPIVLNEPLGAESGAEADTGRIQVCITSFRRRLIDADNLAGGCKYFVDCCRYAKLIPDDRPQDIEFIAKQIKVKKKEDERTEIELTPL